LNFTPLKFGIYEGVPFDFNKEGEIMAQAIFMKADEVQELLGVSKSEAYKIIKQLNDNLKARGYIVISGRVNRRYLEEMIYGYSEKNESPNN